MRLFVVFAAGFSLCAPVVFASALRAETAVVAVDPAFAPVAATLSEMFAEETGYAVELSIEPGPQMNRTRADVLLGTDTDLPMRLADSGRADPATRVTYAMGLTGTEAAARPRDAVILSQAADNPVAVAFLDFLMTSEAWDVIVSHGYGAH